MFTIQDDHDTIAPKYPCGGRGTLVPVAYHSVDYAVWKLVDDLEKHVGVSSHGNKIKCQTCYEKLYTEKAELKKELNEYLKDMTEAMDKAKDVLDSLRDSALETAGKFFAMEMEFGPEFAVSEVEPDTDVV